MAFALQSARAGAADSSLCRPRQQRQARRGVVAFARTPSYYDVLGVEPDASPDDIKAAFRRRAKEAHPDVNGSADAAEAFKQIKQAYETLSDDEARRQYDAVNGTRRLGFFQDQDPEQQEQQGWGRPVDPFEVHRRVWAAEDPRGTASTSGREQREADGGFEDPSELLERLSRMMGPGGGLNPWQTGGRLDPFGSTSSDAWARRVQEQTDNPGLGSRGRPLYGRGSEPGWGRPSGAPVEWDPFRPGDADDPFEQRQGWSNPGRPEWQAPGRRRWDDEDADEDKGGRGGRRGGRGGGGLGGGGDGFRGKPL